MRVLVLALAAAILALPTNGEVAASVFQVDFSNPNLIPAKWTLVLHPDGSGHFHSDRGTVAPSEQHVIEPATIDRDVRLSDDFANHVFDTIRKQKLGDNCESHLKVAFQGLKKFTYSGPDSEDTCEFNYSKNRDIQSLGDSFVAVASTIIEGARLELLLQHDPLGLDHEMEFLMEASKDGRLQQIYAIRGILQKIEDDPSVMERVRKRAGILLAGSTNKGV
jgi:hypothetical protein